MTARRASLIAVVMIAIGLAAGASRTLAAESYQYDAIGRLTDVSYANGSSLHYTYDPNDNVLSVTTSLATAVEESATPLQFAMGPTRPNPGSGARSLSFTLPTRGRVVLRAFDVSGREVATLLDRVLDTGRHDVRFLTDRWAAGVYFYKLESGGQVRRGRMVVLR